MRGLNVLKKVCIHYFGEGRQTSGSHLIFKMPWVGDPPVNIQESKDGKAKPSQVKQVLKAIKKKESDNEQQS
ncbi:MAG: toxin HicA [Clostridia bacterium]|nr:toxin HicA [Deltaproteobacteria bacterium]